MIEHIYTTPIYQKQLGTSILTSIHRYVQTGQFGVSKKAHSTRGGYQSDEEFLKSLDPEIEMFKKEIFACVSEYLNDFFKAYTNKERNDQSIHFELWGWITQFSKGGYNAPHLHPRSTISGVYYVETPTSVLKNEEGDYAGWLCLLDPRANSQNWPLPGQVNNIFISPVPGSIVLFPSSLSHFVPPFHGDGTRTAIAFNLRHKI